MLEPILFGLIAVILLGGILAHPLVDRASPLSAVSDTDDDNSDEDDEDGDDTDDDEPDGDDSDADDEDDPGED